MFAEQPAPQYQVSLGQVGGEAVFQLCEDLAFDSLEFLQRYQNDDWEYVWEYSGSTVFLSAGTLVDSALASELGFDTSGVPRVVNSDGSFGIIAFSGDDVVLDAYFQPSATLSPSREWVRGDDSVGPDPCIDPDAQE